MYIIYIIICILLCILTFSQVSYKLNVSITYIYIYISHYNIDKTCIEIQNMLCLMKRDQK